MSNPSLERSFKLGDDEPLILIFYCCFWGMPAFVEKFLLEARFENLTRIRAVITCGGAVGASDEALNRMLRKRGFPEAECYELPMVTNYSILHDIPNPDQQKLQLRTAETKLELILDGEARPYRSNFLIQAIGRVFYPMYRRFRKTAPFTVDDKCVGCGRCARDCPERTIEIRDGRPVWIKESCDNCLRCLNNCPTAAINYGTATVNRLRYCWRDPE